jgi:hypothetical protein
MNRLLIIFLFLGFTSFEFKNKGAESASIPDAYSGPTTKVPVQSWVYVDIIISDYNTGKPEGHQIYNLVKSYYVNNQDMPVNVFQQMAGDFGKAGITYGNRNDTLFAGSVVWMGTGTVRIPTSLDTNHTVSTQFLAKPTYIQYLNNDSSTVNPDYKQKAELTWTNVSKMQILSAYQGVGFKLAFYLYKPSVGMTDLTKAKWITLLERDAGSW